MERIMINNLNKNIGNKVLIKGWIHRIRKLKKVCFLILRDRTGLVQTVINPETIDITTLKNESVIEIEGEVVESKNTLGNFEIIVEKLQVLSKVEEDLPLEVNTEEPEGTLDTKLNNRVLSLRHIKTNSIFRIQSTLAQGFSEFLQKEGFTQVFSPKIVKAGAEGGTAIFELKYFEEKAYLAQSPQFYKQMLVGSGFERVFEIGQVYRAEEHNTSRHLNEYVSLDLEMGFIKDERDIMELETGMLKFMLKKLKKERGEELELLEVKLPEIQETIPAITLQEAIDILKREYGKMELQGDLDPEGEVLIGRYIKEKYNSDFVFLTNYPRSKRPMYTMPLGEEGTKSFDLLFRGLEITTGGQRIHNYSMLKENMKYKGLKPEDFEEYLTVFKYGMPPHGGLAIGLERLTAQLLNIKNVRETTLFPRDRTRLTP